MNGFEMVCPKCQSKLEVPVEYDGQEVECPACKKKFTVKTPEPDLQNIIPPIKQMHVVTSVKQNDMLKNTQSTTQTHMTIQLPANGLVIAGWITLCIGIIGLASTSIPFIQEGSRMGDNYIPSVGTITILNIFAICIILGSIMLGWIYKNKMVLWIIFFITVFSLYIPFAIFALVLVKKIKKKNNAC